MCFHIDRNFPNALVAEEDIVCYKVLHYYILNITGNNYAGTAPYYSKDYEYNTIYKVEKFGIVETRVVNNIITTSLIRTIDEGLHSYSTPEMAEFQLRFIHPYYWSGKSHIKTFPTLSKDTVICKAIIPKGTEYYYNEESSEYVSLKLKIIERIDKI